MEEIFRKYEAVSCGDGTDKTTCHSYIPIYEKVFKKFKHKPIRLLEIGVCSGASVVAWEEYFTHPDREIHGIDITDECLKFNLKNFRVLDGTKEETPDILGGTWDIIIDDGSHYPLDQMKTLRLFQNRLRDDGIYVIEDILVEDFAHNLIKDLAAHNIEYIYHITDLPNDRLLVFGRNLESGAHEIWGDGGEVPN